MKPLPWIAMGFVIILLTADAGGYDLLPDPIGWVVVLVGMRALPTGLELRSSLWSLAALALVVATVTWVPAVVDALDDPSLRWAAGLPQIAYVAVLAHALTRAAAADDDRRAAMWWSIVRTLTVVVAVLPVLVFGGGMASLTDVAGVVTVLAPLLVIGLLVTHASRPWACAAEPAAEPTADHPPAARRRHSS